MAATIHLMTTRFGITLHIAAYEERNVLNRFTQIKKLRMAVAGRIKKTYRDGVCGYVCV